MGNYGNVGLGNNGGAHTYTTAELTRIAVTVETGFDDQNQLLRWPERDQAVLALLAGAGLRISELCTLSWGRLADLDTPAPMLRVLSLIHI